MNKFMKLAIKEAQIGFRDKQFEEKIPQKEIDMCEEMNREECLKLYEDYKKIQNKTSY